VTRGFEFEIGEYYHLYNRGNDKRRIFLSHTDQRHFLRLLYIANSQKPFHLADLAKGDSIFQADRGETLVDIGAFCILYNHFHLLVREKKQGGVSRFMQKLSTAYAMYFNTRYDRSGTPFEGTYKARHAHSDRYLKYLFSYVYLNPVEHKFPKWKEGGEIDKVKALDYARSYNFSSLSDKAATEYILNQPAFPKYFKNPEEVNAEIFDWLSYATD
jgi:REP element-mobilizing transposase RayT